MYLFVFVFVFLSFFFFLEDELRTAKSSYHISVLAGNRIYKLLVRDKEGIHCMCVCLYLYVCIYICIYICICICICNCLFFTFVTIYLGIPFSASQLEEKIQKIVDEEKSKDLGVSVLTTLGRNEWAKARDRLECVDVSSSCY